MHIAIVAYGCQPGRGSEFGVGWSWVEELVRRGHRLTVYVHGSQRDAIEADALARTDGVCFRYHWPGRWPLEHGNRAVHQLHYTLWQWSVANEIRADGRTTPFDLVHFLTWGGIRMPTFGWRQPVPYIVGPVGGGEEAPLRYCWSIGRRLFVKESGRKIVNRFCLVDPLLMLSYGRAKRNFAKTGQSRMLVPGPGRGKCDIAFEIGSRDDLLAIQAQERDRRPGSIRLISVGRMLSWKSPLTIVAVYAELLRREVDAELIMVGSGPEEAHVRKALAQLPAHARVRFESQLPQSELFALMRDQDLALFASLHDSSGNFVLESLSMGLPVVALALGGPFELLKKGGGIPVAVDGRSHAEVVDAMASEVQRLADAPHELSELRRSARESALDSRWPSVVAKIYQPLEAEFGFVPPEQIHRASAAR